MGLEVSWNLKARKADRTRQGTKTAGRYERVLWGSQRQTRDKDSRANRLFGVGGGDGRTCWDREGGREARSRHSTRAGRGPPTVTTVSPHWREGASVLPGVPRGWRLVEALQGALGPALSTGQLR